MVDKNGMKINADANVKKIKLVNWHVIKDMCVILVHALVNVIDIEYIIVIFRSLFRAMSVR